MRKAREMAYAYEAALGAYRHKSTLKFIKGQFDETTKSYESFKRAALIADQLGVSYEIYIQAQFHWFDQWFKRPPQTWELAGMKSKFPAPERVRKFVELLNSGSVAGTAVIGYARRQKIDAKELDKINDLKLAQVRRVWGLSEEEAFMRFARPGVFYFDPVWLRKHPTYQRLRNQKLL